MSEKLMLDDLVKITESFDSLMASSNLLKKAAEDGIEIIRRQQDIIEVAFDLMVSLATDVSVDVKIRRRLAFALKQMSGSAATMKETVSPL